MPLGFLGALHIPPDACDFFFAFWVYLNGERDIQMLNSFHGMYNFGVIIIIITILYLEGFRSIACKAAYRRTMSASSLADKAVMVPFNASR